VKGGPVEINRVDQRANWTPRHVTKAYRAQEREQGGFFRNVRSCRTQNPTPNTEHATPSTQHLVLPPVVDHVEQVVNIDHPVVIEVAGAVNGRLRGRAQAPAIDHAQQIINVHDAIDIHIAPTGRGED
jgi:hypothetical protein